MENASKALILAGAILIALLIISLSILVFNNFGGKAKEMANMDEQEIKAFNSKITPYIGKKSGSQVNALLQYCLSVNISAKQSGETYKVITVTQNGSTIIYGESTTYTRVAGGSYFNVEGEYDDNGLLTTITITNPQ